MTPNASEATQLTGQAVDGRPGTELAAQRLRAFGAGVACVKFPDGGCLFAGADRTTVIPAIPVPVADTAGAGDAFAGALAVGLSEGRTPFDATCFATAAAHLSLGVYGAQPSYPERPAADRLLSAVKRKLSESG